jgi:rare lipoprotein A
MIAVKHTVLILMALVLNGCATSWQNSAPSGTASAPSSEQKRTNSGELQRSKYGNPPLYEVFGKRYYVMQSSLGFNQRGTASWYGKKFHGRKTSSGEVYNMYALTAAHKSLPLPTNVKVTNLLNGKSVIVRVNDRGPFVGDRVIDMSYAAAQKLGMTEAGTVPVEIVALNAKPRPTNASRNSKSTKTGAGNAVSPGRSAQKTTDLMYIQVGAFGAVENAQRLVKQLSENGIKKTSVTHTTSNSIPLYRVRVGPLSGVTEYDQLIADMTALQITDMRLIFEPARITSERPST